MSPALVLLGWLWALPNTLVGLALAMLGGFRPVRFVGPEHAVVFYVSQGSPLGWFFRKYKLEPGQHIGAQTHGIVILMEPSDDKPATIVHERTHVRQQFRWGVFFYPAYGFESVEAKERGLDPYLANGFEAKAYEVQRAFEASGGAP